MREAAGIPFGSYLLLRRLARGGMAEVFLARQQGPEGFDRQVALKRILPHLVDSEDFVKMFLGEARLAARLSHPNVVHIYEFGKVDEHYFIAMEYVDGVHAGALIDRGQFEQIPAVLVARIGADACAGLHYAHSLRDPHGLALKLVHRDISPPNLMVSHDGVVKLVDFGIAKAVSSVDQTRPGVVKGKFAYMSPEQTMGMQLDGRSDVFSLALVLWELLAGRVAVDRSNQIAAMETIRDGKIPAIETVRPDLPGALTAVLGQALQVKPDDRPSAIELGTAFEGFIKSSPELATSMSLAKWIGERFPRTNLGAEADLAMVPGPTREATMAPPARASGGLIEPARPRPHIPTPQPSPTLPPMDDPVLDQRPRVMDVAPGQLDPRSSFLEEYDENEPPTVVDQAPSFVRIQQIPALIPASERHRVTPAPTYNAAPKRGRRIAIIAGVAIGLIALAFVVLGGGGGASSDAGPAIADDAGTIAPLADGGGASATAPGDGGTRDAALATASLAITTDPDDASVSLSGRPAETAPVTYRDLAPGEYTVAVARRRYRSQQITVTLAPGEHRELNVDLNRKRPREPKTGTLTVKTRPYSVVYLGRRKLGTTPFAGVEVPVGTHTLTFRNPKRKSHRRKVVIRAGKTTKLNFKLP